ncbi:hypothetical protein IG631_05501 [Alternaria alternata]|nr:hypothetical protein IG631_05501 [Alternaria alternata]
MPLTLARLPPSDDSVRPYKPPHLMALVKMITQLIPAIEPLTAIRIGARKEGASVFLHVAAILLTATKRTSTSVRTLMRSCNGGMLNLVVGCWMGGCDRNLRLKLGWGPIWHHIWAADLRNDGYVHEMCG